MAETVNPPAPPNTPAQPTERSLSEIEYRNLIQFFKYVLAITYAAVLLLVAAATYLVGKSVSDAKSDASTAISSFRDSADKEIKQIGDQAALTAHDQAQKSIEQSFERGNIQQMIEGVARAKVGVAVDREIDKNLGARIQVLETEIADVGEVSNEGARLRLEFRPALEALLAKEHSPNKAVGDYARSTLQLVGSDFELRIRQAIGTNISVPMAFQMRGINPPPKTMKDVMEIIRKSNDVYGVALAFMDLNETSGAQISVFDVPAAEKWCDEHKPRCD
jgi:hypothetical protein